MIAVFRHSEKKILGGRTMGGEMRGYWSKILDLKMGIILNLDVL